jgi:hypothetical protein
MCNDGGRSEGKDYYDSVFIDRDALRFAHCLDYMRYGKVFLPPNVSKYMLMLDLDYYGITVVPGTVLYDSEFDRTLPKDYMILAYMCSAKVGQQPKTCFRAAEISDHLLRSRRGLFGKLKEAALEDGEARLLFESCLRTYSLGLVDIMIRKEGKRGDDNRLRVVTVFTMPLSVLRPLGDVAHSP